MGADVLNIVVLLKRTLNFRRLRLRGMTGARDECTLAAIAQNLRKLIKMIGFSPPPLVAACSQLKCEVMVQGMMDQMTGVTPPL
jgi:hypothetical protein